MENSIVQKFILLILIAPIMGGLNTITELLTNNNFHIAALSLGLILMLTRFFKEEFRLINCLNWSVIAFMIILAFVLCTSYDYDLSLYLLMTALSIALIGYIVLAACGKYMPDSSGYMIILWSIGIIVLVTILVLNTHLLFQISVDMISAFVGVILFSAFTLSDYTKAHKMSYKSKWPSAVVTNVCVDFVLLYLFVMYFVSAVSLEY